MPGLRRGCSATGEKVSQRKSSRTWRKGLEQKENNTSHTLAPAMSLATIEAIDRSIFGAADSNDAQSMPRGLNTKLSMAEYLYYAAEKVIQEWEV